MNKKRNYEIRPLTAAIRQPSGTREGFPPPSKTGGTGEQVPTSSIDEDLPSGSTSSRERVSLSVSPELDAALSAAAARLGVTKSQVALQAVMLGLPGVVAQVEAVLALRGGIK